jgi:hypothetical protein
MSEDQESKMSEAAVKRDAEMVETMLDIRTWLEELLGAGGAELTGGGIGMGGGFLGRADVEFTFKGRNYYLTVMDEGLKMRKAS